METTTVYKTSTKIETSLSSNDVTQVLKMLGICLSPLSIFVGVEVVCDICVGDGGGTCAPPPPPPQFAKNWGGGNFYVKFGHFRAKIM